MADWCRACKQLLDVLKQRGTLSNYRVIDVATPEGKDIASKLGILAIPDCIVVARDRDGGELARRCTDAEIKQILSEGSAESGA